MPRNNSRNGLSSTCCIIGMPSSISSAVGSGLRLVSAIGVHSPWFDLGGAGHGVQRQLLNLLHATAQKFDANQGFKKSERHHYANRGADKSGWHQALMRAVTNRGNLAGTVSYTH